MRCRLSRATGASRKAKQVRAAIVAVVNTVVAVVVLAVVLEMKVEVVEVVVVAVLLGMKVRWAAVRAWPRDEKTRRKRRCREPPSAATQRRHGAPCHQETPSPPTQVRAARVGRGARCAGALLRRSVGRRLPPGDGVGTRSRGSGGAAPPLTFSHTPTQTRGAPPLAPPPLPLPPSPTLPPGAALVARGDRQLLAAGRLRGDVVRLVD